MFNGPYVSVMLRMCEHLDAGDGSAIAGMLVVNGAVERLSRGIPVLIFPEGTRSPAESMHPFKSGAFMIACQAKVPVVPLVIRCEPRTLMKGVPWYTVPDHTARFTMSVLPPIATERYGEDLEGTQGGRPSGPRAAPHRLRSARCPGEPGPRTDLERRVRLLESR